MDINDIKVKLTLQVGSSKVSLADLEKMEVGSVVELNTLAGELLNIYANDALVAQGEVVIVNSNYGVRIKKIIKEANKTAKKR